MEDEVSSSSKQKRGEVVKETNYTVRASALSMGMGE